jgi:hypothetical protein
MKVFQIECYQAGRLTHNDLVRDMAEAMKIAAGQTLRITGEIEISEDEFAEHMALKAA